MASSHFTSKEQLKAYLSPTQIEQLFSIIPTNQQEQLLIYADDVIITATGIKPAETDNDSRLVSIASRIVIWYLSGQQQWNDANRAELDRRKDLYNSAIEELENYEALSDDEPITSFFGSSGRRIGDW
ncbi:MAG: hypothetical protein KBG83_00135 [Bacteroidetes bacterium]|nr:hypothetical protein [Bacteroidota bacterium]